jgi:hypothetical protein
MHMHTREADPRSCSEDWESLNQNKFALGVFLDIDGAFDIGSFGSMDAASGEHGVVLTLRRWIDAMLRCRSV